MTKRQRQQIAHMLLIVRREMQHVLNCDGWRAPNHIVYEIAANRMKNRTLLRQSHDGFAMSRYLFLKALIWREER